MGAPIVPEDDEVALAAEDVQLKPTDIQQEVEKMEEEAVKEKPEEKVKEEIPEEPEMVERVKVKEEMETPTLPQAAEEDAVMALLGLQSAPVVTPPKKVKEELPPPPAELSEHNYFALPVTPKKGEAGAVVQPPQPGEDDTDSASEGEPELILSLPPSVSMDHNYCQIHLPIEETPEKKRRQRALGVITSLDDLLPAADLTGVTPGPSLGGTEEVVVEVNTSASSKPRKRPSPRKHKLKDVTNLEGSRELMKLLPPPKPKPKFTTRSLQEELQLMYEFLLKGIDTEDMAFLKSRWEWLTTVSINNAW